MTTFRSDDPWKALARRHRNRTVSRQMLIDTRTIPDESQIEADICIIGAGAAGISMALEFADTSTKICLVESGGLKPDRVTQNLYVGNSVGWDYDLEQTRTRFFGGSTNCWGGWCRAFHEDDFKNRSWVPNSGWPLTKDDLNPYYRRAADLMGLSEVAYSLEEFQAANQDSELQLLAPNSARIGTEISQLLEERHLGRAQRDPIKLSQNIRVYLNANLTRLNAASNGRYIDSAAVQCLNGVRATVRAKFFVLACGGIENARLLLHANDVMACGLGNQHDLVGRFFMDHPRQEIGTLHLRNPDTVCGLYDLHTGFFHSSLIASFNICFAEQKKNKTANSYTYINMEYSDPNAKAIKAFREVVLTLHKSQYFNIKARDLLTVVTSPIMIARHLVGTLLRPKFLLKRQRLEMIIEPVPNPDSRVTLSDNTDALGMRRSNLDWRLSDLDKRTFLRSRRILAEELERTGTGRVEFDQEDDEFELPKDIRYSWHHMGTTRMHDDPKKGVVNPHCQVNGIENLFVSGSSVFPTVAADMPTLTISALAIRTADRLKELLTEPIRKSGRAVETSQDYGRN